MTVTTYTNVNGQILCQSKGGGVTHFVSDPLGSVIMVRDTAGATVYEAECDPYGNVQSETGTNSSELGFVGTLGSVRGSAFALYVRARNLLTNLGRWLSRDPLWPSLPSYVFGWAKPHLPQKGSWHALEGIDRWLKCLLDPLSCIRPQPSPWDIPLPLPIQPPPGKADYHPGWTPFDFAYGKCCGAGRQCNCESEALDCIDRACRQHDSSIPGPIEYIIGSSHSTFCRDLISCDCEKDHGLWTVNYRNCQRAKAKMMGLYCLHALILPRL